MPVRQVIWSNKGQTQQLSPAQTKELADLILQYAHKSPVLDYYIPSDKDDPDVWSLFFWREETAEELKAKEQKKLDAEESLKTFELIQLQMLANKYPEAGYRKVEVK